MSDSDQDHVKQPEEGFLSRWSRRKHADRAVPDDAVSKAQQSADTSSSMVESELPGDDDMPPIESLDEDSDYSGFMSPKVSEGLRMLALRKLFRGQSFNLRDGLDDYDDDFSSFAKLGDVVTAEMRRQMERMKGSLQDDMSSGAEQNEEAEASEQYAEVDVRLVEGEAGLEPDAHIDADQTDREARAGQGIKDETE
jgi:hypothetical protein